MIYLDPSALAKLVVEEAESDALAAWLDDHEDEVLFTSALSEVGLVRAAVRRPPETMPAALALIAELSLVPVDATIVDLAWSLGPAALRSMDALQLASALSVVGDAVNFDAYDTRLLEAASASGLTAMAPGAE